MWKMSWFSKTETTTNSPVEEEPKEEKKTEEKETQCKTCKKPITPETIITVKKVVKSKGKTVVKTKYTYCSDGCVPKEYRRSMIETEKEMKKVGEELQQTGRELQQMGKDMFDEARDIMKEFF